MVSHNINQPHKRRWTTKKDKKFEDSYGKEKENSLRGYFYVKKKKKRHTKRIALREGIGLKRKVITYYPLYVLKPI